MNPKILLLFINFLNFAISISDSDEKSGENHSEMDDLEESMDFLWTQGNILMRSRPKLFEKVTPPGRYFVILWHWKGHMKELAAKCKYGKCNPKKKYCDPAEDKFLTSDNKFTEKALSYMERENAEAFFAIFFDHFELFETNENGALLMDGNKFSAISKLLEMNKTLQISIVPRIGRGANLFRHVFNCSALEQKLLPMADYREKSRNGIKMVVYHEGEEKQQELGKILGKCREKEFTERELFFFVAYLRQIHQQLEKNSTNEEDRENLVNYGTCLANKRNPLHEEDDHQLLSDICETMENSALFEENDGFEEWEEICHKEKEREITGKSSPISSWHIGESSASSPSLSLPSSSSFSSLLLFPSPSSRHLLKHSRSLNLRKARRAGGENSSRSPAKKKTDGKESLDEKKGINISRKERKPKVETRKVADKEWLGKKKKFTI